MARASRIDTPGSWHHLINRGLAKRPLFENRSDARFFLARLVRQVRLGRLELHAYCLMTTHFHLLVRSPIGEMSEAMRRAQNEYSRFFNRRRRRDGSLVRGRYLSRPVLSLFYRRTLVRYIDANPVRAGMVRKSEEYELGSAAAYHGGAKSPWLTRSWVEAEACRVTGSSTFTPASYRSAFGVKSTTDLEELSELVDARVARNGREDPLDDLIHAAPEEIQRWMRRKAALADGLRPGQALCSTGSLHRALHERGEAAGDWIVKENCKSWHGAELVWHGLARQLCGQTWREIAAQSNVSQARSARLDAVHRRLMNSHPEYARRAAEVACRALTMGS